MSEVIKSRQGPLTELEAKWNTPRAAWTKAQWREAAEFIDDEIDHISAEVELLRNPPKKGPGRPRKKKYENVLAKWYLESVAGAPTTRRGRPRLYSDEKWEMIFDVVEQFRTEIESETGKKPTIKAAIEKLARDWGLAKGRSKREQRKEVVRWQKLYSRAKEKIAKMQK